MPDATAERLAYSELCTRVAKRLRGKDRHAMYRLAKLLRRKDSKASQAVDEGDQS